MNIKPAGIIYYDRNKDFEDSKTQYVLDNDQSALVRYHIRDNIEKHFDPTYLYLHEFGRRSPQEIKNAMQKIAAKNAYCQCCEEENNNTCKVNVDIQKLNNLGIAYGNERRKNELYSGAKLSTIPEGRGIEAAKEAGIKTIVALEGTPGDEYEKMSKKAGLNHVCLFEIGNKTLNPFAIIPTYVGGKVIKQLISNPSCWATQEPNGTTKQNASPEICDLQEFIDILDGKNEKFPLPIYYGCSYGTNRTYAWTAIYNILRDADRTQPLDEKHFDDLIELYGDLEDTFKS